MITNMNPNKNETIGKRALVTTNGLETGFRFLSNNGVQMANYWFWPKISKNVYPTEKNQKK